MPWTLRDPYFDRMPGIATYKNPVHIIDVNNDILGASLSYKGEHRVKLASQLRAVEVLKSKSARKLSRVSERRRWQIQWLSHGFTCHQFSVYRHNNKYDRK